MFGSIFYNFWFALAGFTIYFFARFQSNQAPLITILYGLMWAAIAFIVAYIVRALIAYIIATPSDQLEQPDEGVESDTEAIAKEERSSEESLPSPEPTVEFSGEQSEEIAKAIQTMMQDGK